MKKYIKGRVYDTETADCVGRWDNSCDSEDPNFCMEDLFQKRTGEFFLYGKGGSASKYAKSSGHSARSGDEKIFPLTYDEAKKWAEEHISADMYKTAFGAS